MADLLSVATRHLLETDTIPAVDVVRLGVQPTTSRSPTASRGRAGQRTQLRGEAAIQRLGPGPRQPHGRTTPLRSGNLRSGLLGVHAPPASGAVHTRAPRARRARHLPPRGSAGGSFWCVARRPRRRAGRRLARWHDVSAQLNGIEGARPWVLDIDRPNRIAALDANHLLRAVALKVAEDPVLRGIAAGLRDDWTSDVVIHGDMRLANVLVCRSPPAIRFVDWETSGWGDPRWDLAGLVQELITAALMQGHDQLVPPLTKPFGRSSPPIVPPRHQRHARPTGWGRSWRGG